MKIQEQQDKQKRLSKEIDVCKKKLGINVLQNTAITKKSGLIWKKTKGKGLEQLFFQVGTKSNTCELRTDREVRHFRISFYFILLQNLEPLHIINLHNAVVYSQVENKNGALLPTFFVLRAGDGDQLFRVKLIELKIELP